MKNVKVSFKVLFIVLLMYVLGSIAIVVGTDALRKVQAEAIENITDSIMNSSPVAEGMEEMPEGFTPDDSMMQTIIDQQTEIIKVAAKKQQDKIFAIMLTSSTICLLLTCFITEDIRKSLKRIAKKMQVLEKGDFSEDVAPAYVKRKDEFGDVARGMQELTENMRSMISAIEEGAQSLNDIVSVSSESIDTVSSEVQGVNAATQELSASNEELASSTEEINTVMNQVGEVARNIATRAEENTETVTQIHERAKSTKNKVAQNRVAIKNVHESISETLMQALEDAKIVDEISVLSESIMGITAQTNLLSLNASIEAARAGEAGKGFAVVADEIRDLSEQSKNTVTHIQEVTAKVTGAVENLTEDSQRLLNFVAGDVSDSFDMFDTMADSYNDDAKYMDDLITDFSAISEELLASIDNVEDSISQITEAANMGADATSNIASNVETVAEETAVIDDKLQSAKEEAKKLVGEVEVFKIA